MLIAAIRSGSPLAGKAVSFSEDDGKFWLTGVGEISADRLVEYEQAGELEWADDATRSWALQRAGNETAASAPPPDPPRPTVSDAPPASVSTPSMPPPKTEIPTSRVAPEPLEARDEEPASVVPAPLARRGKRAERPDFVAGEKERWRPSRTQWRAAGYVVIALAMIAAVVAMGIWRLGSDEPTGASTTTLPLRLTGSTTSTSETFDLTAGAYRLSFAVESLDVGKAADYAFAIVPSGTPESRESDYVVKRGVISPGYSTSDNSGEVLFERTAGSYYLKVLSNNCGWTAEVSATN